MCSYNVIDIQNKITWYNQLFVVAELYLCTTYSSHFLLLGRHHFTVEDHGLFGKMLITINSMFVFILWMNNLAPYVYAYMQINKIPQDAFLDNFPSQDYKIYCKRTKLYNF